MHSCMSLLQNVLMQRHHMLVAEHERPAGSQVALAVRCMSLAQARVSTSTAASLRVAVHRTTVVLCLSKGGFAGALPSHELLVFAAEPHCMLMCCNLCKVVLQDWRTGSC